MTIRELLSVLAARWRIIALTLMTVVAATAVQTMLTPSVYTATAKIYLAASKPVSTTDGKQTGGGVYAISASDLATYVDVLTAPAVIDPLKQSLGLDLRAPLSVSADVSQTSNMMTITATSGDPVMAANIANGAGPILAKIATEKFSPLLAANGQSVQSETIAQAQTPGGPTSPNGKRNLMLGALLGLVLGIGLAL
ncbi:MAG: Wzz/FepE/Etk N-terminal domain-containing protein, partial [Humibacillus sp.]